MTARPPKPRLVIRLLRAEADTLALGRKLAAGIAPGMVIYLRGDLGAGKTTLARGILQGLGHAGRVKSPTYTLVEVYGLSRIYLYHFDFYRFDDPREGDEAGFREYFRADSVCLVEWPEKAAGLPPADVNVAMQVAGSGRSVELRAEREAGKLCLDRLTR